MRLKIYLCATLVGVCYASVRSDEIPEQVSTALKQNAEQLVPLEISWKSRPKVLVSEDQLKTDYGESDLTRFHADREDTVLLDDAKISQHSRTPQAKYSQSGELLTDETDGVDYRISEKTFDKEYWYSGTGTKKMQEIGATPALTIERLADTREKLKGNLFRMDYFENAGFFVSQTADELGLLPASLVLKTRERAATTDGVSDKIEGESCYKVTCVSSSGTTIWWLSESKNYAILRSETLDEDGKVISRTENRDFVKLGDRNVWLPKRIDRYLHRWNYRGPISETAVVVEESRVTDISTEAIASERFVLNYEVPGTIVSDAKLADSMNSSQDQLEYQIPAKQEDLDRVLEQAALGKVYHPPLPQRSVSLRVVLVGNVLALLTVLALWLKLRKKKSGG